MSAFSLSGALVIIVCAMTLVVADKPLVTLCHIAWGLRPHGVSCAAHTSFAVSYFADEVPNITFQLQILSVSGNANTKDVVRSVLAAPTSCDAFLGPTTSGLSIAVNPFIAVPWISDTASSVDLSNKAVYPWFSRTIPRDDAAGSAIAALSVALGWKTANVVCSDESYGRSISSGFTSAFRKLGGAIAVSRCISTFNNVTSAEALQGIVSQSASKIILIAANSVGADPIVQAAVTMGLHRTHIFLLTDVNCGRTDVTKQLPGALCVAFLTDQQRFAVYKQAFLDNLSSISANLYDPTLNLGLPQVDLANIIPNSALSVDSARYLMSGFHSLYRKLAWNATAFNETVKNQRQTVLRWMRSNSSLLGLTGPFLLSEVGDRIGASMAFVNIQPNETIGPQQVVFGSWNEVDGTTLSNVSQTGLYWLGTGFGPIPKDIDPDSNTASISVLIIVVFVVVLILLVIVGIIIKARKRIRELLERLDHSGGSITALGALLLYLADTVTDGIAAYFAFTTKQIPHSLAIAAVVCASVGFVTVVLRFFWVLLVSYRLMTEDLTAQEISAYRTKMNQWRVLCSFIEDLPMIGVGVALLQYTVRAPFLVSIILSSVCIAQALVDVKVLSSLLPSSRGRLEAEVHAEALKLLDGPLDRFTPREDLKKIAQLVEKMDPEEFRRALLQADIAAISLTSVKIRKSAFFAVYLPRLYDQVEYDKSHAETKPQRLDDPSFSLEQSHRMHKEQFAQSMAKSRRRQ